MEVDDHELRHCRRVRRGHLLGDVLEPRRRSLAAAGERAVVVLIQHVDAGRRRAKSLLVRLVLAPAGLGFWPFALFIFKTPELFTPSITSTIAEP